MNTQPNVQKSIGAPKWDEQTRVLYASHIEAARKAVGLTQSQLAERSGVSRGTIGNIESGSTIPQADVLWRILGVLDIRAESTPEWSPEVDGWVRIIAPLIEQIPNDVRERVMLILVAQLGRSARGEND